MRALALGIGAFPGEYARSAVKYASSEKYARSRRVCARSRQE